MSTEKTPLLIFFWTLFIVTMGVYATMLTWSLPTIAGASDGLSPFDMRPSGYDLQEAKALLTAMPIDVQTFYRDVQVNLLDMIYPALLSLTLFLAIALMTPSGFGRWRWVAGLIAVPIAIFDYLENASIRAMLAAGHDSLTTEMVATASQQTVVKSMFTIAAETILLVMLLLWLWKKYRPAKPA
jgi:hypothetical protein